MALIEYQIVPASVRHIKPLSQHLRRAHCASLAPFGITPREAMMRAFRASTYCRTAMMGNTPAAMWGIAAPLLSEHAAVWVAISDELTKWPLAIVRCARKELHEMTQRNGILYATILPEDKRAEVFSRTLGFIPIGLAIPGFAKDDRLAVVMFGEP